jgi:putative transcriptional regulator
MRHWLVLHRQKRNLTQTLVALQAGISRAFYTQLELARRDPSVKVAKKIGLVLEFDWHKFFEDNPDTSQTESIKVSAHRED